MKKFDIFIQNIENLAHISTYGANDASDGVKIGQTKEIPALGRLVGSFDLNFTFITPL